MDFSKDVFRKADLEVEVDGEGGFGAHEEKGAVEILERHQEGRGAAPGMAGFRKRRVMNRLTSNRFAPRLRAASSREL